MKKLYFIGILCLSFIFLVGCQASQSLEEAKITTVNIDELLEYKDSYVGDNSAVGGIINNLPGNIFFQGMALKTDNRPYGIEINYGVNPNLGQEDFTEYWTVDQTKKYFLNNATTLFILVKNVDEVKFNLTSSLDTQSEQVFNISRSELEEFYGKDLRLYAEDKKLWQTEIIEEKLNSREALDSFFKTHPIKKNTK